MTPRATPATRDGRLVGVLAVAAAAGAAFGAALAVRFAPVDAYGVAVGGAVAASVGVAPVAPTRWAAPAACLAALASAALLDDPDAADDVAWTKRAAVVKSRKRNSIDRSIWNTNTLQKTSLTTPMSLKSTDQTSWVRYGPKVSA